MTKRKDLNLRSPLLKTCQQTAIAIVYQIKSQTSTQSEVNL